MLSTLKTKQYWYFGMHSLMFSKSFSFCSRVFFATCVRWNTFVLFDLGIVTCFECVFLGSERVYVCVLYEEVGSEYLSKGTFFFCRAAHHRNF